MFERQVCTALDATDQMRTQVTLQGRLLLLQYGLRLILATALVVMREGLGSCDPLQCWGV